MLSTLWTQRSPHSSIAVCYQRIDVRRVISRTTEHKSADGAACPAGAARPAGATCSARATCSAGATRATCSTRATENAHTCLLCLGWRITLHAVTRCPLRQALSWNTGLPQCLGPFLASPASSAGTALEISRNRQSGLQSHQFGHGATCVPFVSELPLCNCHGSQCRSVASIGFE